MKQYPLFSEGQCRGQCHCSSQTLSLIFRFIEDGVGQQLELHGSQIPLDLLLSFFNCGPDVELQLLLHIIASPRREAMKDRGGSQFVFVVYYCPLPCFMPSFSSWLLSPLIYSKFMLSSGTESTTFHSTHSCICCIPSNWSFLISLCVFFFFPDWTLNYREVHTRRDLWEHNLMKMFFEMILGYFELVIWSNYISRYWWSCGQW